MKCKQMLNLLLEKETGKLFNVNAIKGLEKLIKTMEDTNLETAEAWLEVHYNWQTDFIIEFRDYAKVQEYAEKMMLSANLRGYSAWKLLADTIKLINANAMLCKYMHVLTLEFDLNEITNYTFCPCFFFEFDVEKIAEKGECDVWRVYDEFNEIISQITRNAIDLEHIKKTILGHALIWNIGFMKSRTDVPRIVCTPIKYKNSEMFLETFFKKENILGKYDLETEDDIMLDFDYCYGELSNIGIAIYQKKYERRLNIVKKLLDQNAITNKEYEIIKGWPQKRIMRDGMRSKLLLWQYAHFKIKIGEKNAFPKIYLRVREIE